jgi:hypothetical protein
LWLAKIFSKLGSALIDKMKIIYSE